MTLRRRDFLVGAALGLAAVTPAVAQDFVGSIIAQLRQQGFQTVLQERTLLGRVRITASKQDGRREIIVNPRTGEILRDLWTPRFTGRSTVEIIKDKSDNGGGDAADDEDDDDEDDDDEDDDDSDDSDEDDSEDDSESDGGDDDED